MKRQRRGGNRRLGTDDGGSDREAQTKKATYKQLSTREWVTKGKDREARLTNRTKCAEAVAAKERLEDDDDDDYDDDDDDDDDEETEKLESKARDLTSQLKKADRAEAQARDKAEKERAKQFSRRIQSRQFMKQPKVVTLVPTRKHKKTLKMEMIKSADKEDEEDTIPEGFHLQEESPQCLNMQRAEDYQA